MVISSIVHFWGKICTKLQQIAVLKLTNYDRNTDLEFPYKIKHGSQELNS